MRESCAHGLEDESKNPTGSKSRWGSILEARHVIILLAVLMVALTILIEFHK